MSCKRPYWFFFLLFIYRSWHLVHSANEFIPSLTACYGIVRHSKIGHFKGTTVTLAVHGPPDCTSWFLQSFLKRGNTVCRLTRPRGQEDGDDCPGTCLIQRSLRPSPPRYRQMDSAPLLFPPNLTLAWSVLQLDHTFSPVFLSSMLITLLFSFTPQWTRVLRGQSLTPQDEAERAKAESQCQSSFIRPSA